MTRSTRQTTRTRRASPPPRPRPTPVPPAQLHAYALELQGLLEELAALTGCGAAWGMRALRRNVELALLNPRTLDRADNQLDFIEELAEAVWDGGDAGFRQAVASPTAEETVRREQRRRAAVGRLDHLAHHLCAAAEAWRDLVVAAAEAARAGAVRPQEDHSS